MHYKTYICNIICILTSITYAHGSTSVTAGIGPGWYNTENMLGNFKLTDPHNDVTCNTTSLFKTNRAPIVAVLFGATLQPHKNALISGLITGGVLPNGTGCFTTKEFCESQHITKSFARFNGHFFISAYGSGGINFSITKNSSIQTFLGYGLNSEYLNVYIQKPRALFGRFTREFVGPLAAIAGIYKWSKCIFSGNYQFMIGTAQNTITYPTLHTHLNIAIPCIMNTITATASYPFNKNMTFMLNLTYTNLHNYKKGRVATYIDCIHQSNNASVLHYYIKLVTLYAQCIITF